MVVVPFGRTTGHTRILPVGLLALLLLLGIPSLLKAVGNDLVEEFTQGRFQRSRELLTGADVDDPGNALLNLLLTSDPAQSLALAVPAAGNAEEDRLWQARWTLEQADLAFARREYDKALQSLEPILHREDTELAGQVFLRAGLSWRALGRLQKAREMLASIRPQDGVFPLGRYYLGDIALENGDPELALRYFDNAAQAWDGREPSLIAGATYRALRALGREEEAGRMLREYEASHEDGLAWLGVRPAPDDRTDSIRAEEPSAPTSGKFCLQFGAFRDRALALGFLDKHSGQIPDLRIVSSADSQGLLLYRVRAGAFNDPEQARARARELKDRYGLAAIVKESD